ncbi:MAG: (Fe-S)-binding protein [Chloroflexi bacterium]|nr:(Fe-S)-binding protein [Chloroflexota bacterium]
MLELKFDKKKCADCKAISCLVKCQYIDLNKTEAKKEWQKVINGEDSFVLDACTTCYACEEYCPFGNHPFYLIVERQEEKNVLAAPRALIKQWVNMCAPSGKFMLGDVKEKTASLCFMPRLGSLAQGKLFEDVATSWILGAEFFCNAVYLHFSRMSVIKERLPKVIENISKQGIKELICLHDECYATYNSLAPACGIDVPFKTIHYMEHLYQKLKENKSGIKPLNVKAAYQRNCSTRLVPQIDHFVDDIFGLIGVTRLDREYDRENALCCGALIWASKGYDAGHDVQQRNIDDMVKHGAEYCVFNCPACWDPLAEKVAKKGIKPIHMIDLCKLAMGEEQALKLPEVPLEV